MNNSFPICDETKIKPIILCFDYGETNFDLGEETSFDESATSIEIAHEKLQDFCKEENWFINNGTTCSVEIVTDIKIEYSILYQVIRGEIDQIRYHLYKNVSSEWIKYHEGSSIVSLLNEMIYLNFFFTITYTNIIE